MVRFVGVGRSLAAIQRTDRDQDGDAETGGLAPIWDGETHKEQVTRVFKGKTGGLANSWNTEGERPGSVMGHRFQAAHPQNQEHPPRREAWEPPACAQMGTSTGKAVALANRQPSLGLGFPTCEMEIIIALGQRMTLRNDLGDPGNVSSLSVHLPNHLPIHAF